MEWSELTMARKGFFLGSGNFGVVIRATWQPPSTPHIVSPSESGQIAIADLLPSLILSPGSSSNKARPETQDVAVKILIRAMPGQ